MSRVIDERGRRCPLPIIALGRAAAADPGAEVTLLTDDPAALHDVPAWCRMKGAVLVSSTIDGAEATFVVQLPKQG